MSAFMHSWGQISPNRSQLELMLTLIWFVLVPKSPTHQIGANLAHLGRTWKQLGANLSHLGANLDQLELI